MHTHVGVPQISPKINRKGAVMLSQLNFKVAVFYCIFIYTYLKYSHGGGPRDKTVALTFIFVSFDI
jgi:hypothetical protein